MMQTHVRKLLDKAQPIFGRIRAASPAVKLAVAAELTLSAGLGLTGWLVWLGPLVERLADQAPPWDLVIFFPLAGVAGSLARLWRVDEIARRWHGVALRRIDERWGSS